MSKIDDLTRLRHIRDAASEALSFVKNRTREDLDNDRMLSLALVRLMSNKDFEEKQSMAR